MVGYHFRVEVISMFGRFGSPGYTKDVVGVGEDINIARIRVEVELERSLFLEGTEFMVKCATPIYKLDEDELDKFLEN